MLDKNFIFQEKGNYNNDLLVIFSKTFNTCIFYTFEEREIVWSSFLKRDNLVIFLKYRTESVKFKKMAFFYKFQN